MQLHAIAAAVSWALGDIHDRFPAAFAQFARVASPAVLDAMWQGAAVALGLVIFLKFVPRISAAHRFAAWTAGFAVVAALPFLPVVAHMIPGASSAAELSSAAVAPRPWFQLDDRWALVIAALWIFASILRAVQLIRHSLRLRKLWKTARPIANDVLLASVGALHAVVCTTPALDRPSVIGFFAPRILIPEWLYARLNPQELAHVVLHEAEHLRRHDDWTNLIQKFALVLFPLNPALAWIERRLCREREMACDEGVVQQTNAPHAYAACLASLAERGLQREMARRAESLSLAAWRRRPELVQRVHDILSRKPALSPVAARVLLSLMGCGLLAASVELARSPQLVAFVAAQKPQELAQADAVYTDRPAAHTPVGTPTLAKVTPGVHMFETKAIMPSGPNSRGPAATATASVNRDAHLENEVSSREAADGTPRQTLLMAQMPSNNTKRTAQQNANMSRNSTAAEYVVFTAYEQVETLPQGSREIADYDTNAAAVDPQAANQNATDPQNSATANVAPVAQITVTRLIFRIDPADATKRSNNKPAPESKSIHQPAVIPFGNGWLVFQL